MSQRIKKTFLCTEEQSIQIKKNAKKNNMSEDEFVAAAVEYFINQYEVFSKGVMKHEESK